MSTYALAAIASLASLLLVLPIALRDPKRLRSLRRPVPRAGAERRVLGWGTLLPGLGLALAGQWPAFLIWLGAVTTLGWLLVQLLARVGGAALLKARSEAGA
ncbi:hypothetical protein D0B54_11930 [Solimonas sp. K1W22B-7]|uniref:hypothetical protein n=1 Tax=Solimonas sp. K1W22B-7 TaxID=2303331 RepID=UPI000E32EBDA|nr:hypothetical protein [Solimonas sp. K1W22B-7]AXQ29358.1 hypothetical protein D0B54_11930 [Solimonas sp. K1W22B-7]